MVMLYDMESPPLSSAAHSPRWNPSRDYYSRRRGFIIVLLVLFGGVGFTYHYFSPASPPPSPASDPSLPSSSAYGGTSLKSLGELASLPLHQQDQFSALEKPIPEEISDPPSLEKYLPPEQALKYGVASAPLPQKPVGLANRTLDFAKIYVLNLEAREDRRDEMTLLAAASGIELTFVPGVNSKTLEPQSLPDSYAAGVIMEPAHLACYRGHANIWRKIVEEGIETALILEDDVDWDLNIREIVPRVKDALTRITGDPNPFSNSPSWDLLYLGTCYEEYFYPHEYDKNKANEIFVDIPEDRENLDPEVYDWVKELVEAYYNDTISRRVLVKGKNPVCTHGYAVTQHAARRMLLEMNEWLPFPVDITMIHYISEGRLKAYSVLPPLLVQWRNTNDPRKNSDIEGAGIELDRNWGILRSARKHLKDWVTLGANHHRWWDSVPIRNN